ncbi:MAG: hypothetical protein KDD48_04245 [Bdellovibrionales bacterium]|nr:hypothetical protein [Bdellovibrionales bacterium]
MVSTLEGKLKSFAILLVSLNALATLEDIPNVETLTMNANQVVVATVREIKKNVLIDQQKHEVNVIVLDVFETIKGQKLKTIQFRQPSRNKMRRLQSLFHQPRFSEGEKVFLFLSQGLDQSFLSPNAYGTFRVSNHDNLVDQNTVLKSELNNKNLFMGARLKNVQSTIQRGHLVQKQNENRLTLGDFKNLIKTIVADQDQKAHE